MISDPADAANSYERIGTEMFQEVPISLLWMMMTACVTLQKYLSENGLVSRPLKMLRWHAPNGQYLA